MGFIIFLIKHLLTDRGSINLLRFLVQLGGTSFTNLKPPVNIELFICRCMGYFNGFKFTGNLSPYIALLLISHYSTASISYPVQWMILSSIYVHVCIKINGVTSIGTQNKSRTTFLYLPTIILYVTYTINKHKFYTYYTSV